jgi:DNA primase
MRKARQVVLKFAGREVVITNPDKPFFPQAGHTKLHLVRYYAAVAEGALRGIARRWSCAFRRGGRRERLLCATRRSFCGW